MEDSGAVRFLYGTVPGRMLLKAVMGLRLDRAAAAFLRSPLSKGIIPRYIRRHEIPMEQFENTGFRSFQDFFLREKKHRTYDPNPDHLISPCDGWLSVCRVGENSEFFIKGSRYELSDLIRDPKTAGRFAEGVCLIFRLCASDYHHYCYVDNGILERTGYIEGRLHSVQPIACRTYPVYSLNRRVWNLMRTDHFGPVVQTEVGALIVGRIVNRKISGQFFKGEEKGRFELSGSTILLFLEEGRVTLRPEIRKALGRAPEVRVEIGSWIADRKENS